MNAQYANAPVTKGIRVLVNHKLPEGTQLYTTYTRRGHGITLKPTRKSKRVQAGYVIETNRGDGHYHYVTFLNPLHCAEWYEAIAWIYQDKANGVASATPFTDQHMLAQHPEYSTNA